MMWPMDLDPVVIGPRIAKRRHQLGITQAELATDLHVSKSTVANWERGKHLPIRHLGAIELKLGITLTVEDTPPARPDAREKMLAAVERLRREADQLSAMLGEDEENN